MPDDVDYRRAILSSAETILGFARGRNLSRDPRVAEAIAALERVIASCRADGCEHAHVREVVLATSLLRRTIRERTN